MRAHSSYSTAGISSSSSRWLRTFLLVTVPVFAPACSLDGEGSEELPDKARIAVGSIGADARVLGGLQTSESLRSFVSALQDESSGEPFPFDEEDREFWTRIGLDVDHDDFAIFAGVSDLYSEAAPGIVLYAPVDEARMDDLAASSDRAEKLDGSASQYLIQAQERSLYLSIPQSGTVLLAPSPESLDAMQSRMAESRDRLDLSEDRLLGSIASAQAWLLIRDYASVIENVSVDRIPEQLAGIARAVAAVGGSASVRSEELEMDLYLEPKERVGTNDLADLLRGAVAAVKLMDDAPPEFLDIINQIEISHDGFLVQTHLSLTREDARAILLLMRSHEAQKSRQ